MGTRLLGCCLALGVTKGVNPAIAFGIVIIAVFMRVPDYLVSGLFMIALALVAKTGSASRFVKLSRFLPYRHHDLLYFPLPGLRAFLVGLHRVSPQDGEARIAEAMASVGQQRPARKALALLRAEGR